MTKTQKFSAIIEDAGKGGAYVVVPFNVKKSLAKNALKSKLVLMANLTRARWCKWEDRIIS